MKASHKEQNKFMEILIKVVVSDYIIGTIDAHTLILEWQLTDPTALLLESGWPTMNGVQRAKLRPEVCTTHLPK
jgi:hypothetical protein